MSVSNFLFSFEFTKLTHFKLLSCFIVEFYELVSFHFDQVKFCETGLGFLFFPSMLCHNTRKGE